MTMKPMPKVYKSKDFTKDELAYYKGDGKFHIGAKEYAEIDKGGENNYDSIRNCAIMDLGFKDPRRTLKDFDNKSEYMLYDATLYEAVTAIENGFASSVLGG